MDSIFGVGLPEFILILIIAGMVMGPERIMRSARTLGVLTARLQNVSRAFMRQLSAELDSVDNTGQLRSTAAEVKRLQQEVAELRDEVVTLTTGIGGGKKSRSKKAGLESGNSILPPVPSLTNGQPASGTPRSNTVNRPPNLTTTLEKSSSDVDADNARVNRPPQLPRRVEIAEDPDT